MAYFGSIVFAFGWSKVFSWFPGKPVKNNKKKSEDSGQERMQGCKTCLGTMQAVSFWHKRLSEDICSGAPKHGLHPPLITFGLSWEKESIHRPAPVQNFSLPKKKWGATEEKERLGC